jgi:hypothetical protein
VNRSLNAALRVACGVVAISWFGFSVPGLTNGNFNGSLAGWTTVGSASAVGTEGNIAPVSGSFQALIGSGDDDDTLARKSSAGHPHISRRRSLAPRPSHAPNPKAGDPDFPDVPEASLESVLGLAPGAIGVALPNNRTPTDGSVLYQTFSAAAGSTLAFYWNFATNEEIPSPYDAALYSLRFGSNQANVYELADTTETGLVDEDPGGASNFAAMTGYQLQSIVLPSTGTYTIGFISMQTGDNDVSSATFISDVTLNGSSIPATTPAPAAWSLGLLGLGFLAIYSGVRKFRQAN